MERITRNAAYFDSIKPSLDKFFSVVLLPCLLRARVIDYHHSVTPASATQTAAGIIPTNVGSYNM